MKSQMRGCIEQSVGRVSSAAACVPGAYGSVHQSRHSPNPVLSGILGRLHPIGMIIHLTPFLAPTLKNGAGQGAMLKVPSF